MAITNLTNTTWKIKENPSLISGSTIDFNINYISIGINKTKIRFDLDQNVIEFYDTDDIAQSIQYSISYFKNNGYSNDNGVTFVEYNNWASEIHFIDGIDIENQQLISWLETNAIQVDNNHFNIINCSTERCGIFIGAGSHNINKYAVLNTIPDGGYTFTNWSINKSGESISTTVIDVPLLIKEQTFKNILVIPNFIGFRREDISKIKLKDSNNISTLYSIKDTDLRTNIDSFFSKLG